MKKIINTLLLIMVAFSAAVAQVPQGFSYQAVVRDNGGNIVANRNINISLSILSGTSADNATAVYSETHSATTNANGLFTIVIGGGNSSQSFSAIDWSKGSFFVKTETEFGSSTSQLLSVPFALYAANAGNGGSTGNNIDLTPYIKATDADQKYVLKQVIEEYAKVTDLKNYSTTADADKRYALSDKLKDQISSVIPTKVSAFENDAKYITETQADAKYATKADFEQLQRQIEAATDKVESKVRALNTMLSVEQPFYVDLGLTSGNKWATCNVGATKPYETGDYFAWGETLPYHVSYQFGTTTDNNGNRITTIKDVVFKSDKPEGYSWASYTIHSDGKYTTEVKDNGNGNTVTEYIPSNITKYNATDGKTVLDPVDDVANWSEGWKTPTLADWQELFDQCYWISSDYYATNSSTFKYLIPGFYVFESYDKAMDKGFSKASNHNYNTETDNYIFIPLASVLSGKAEAEIYLSQIAFYWTSELTDEIAKASAVFLLYQSQTSYSLFAPSSSERCLGCPIRAIYTGTISNIPTDTNR